MANFLEVILRCLMVSVLSCRVESGIDANHDLFQGFRTTNSPANGRKGTETSRDDIETGVPIIPEIIPEELPTKCEYPDQRLVILPGPQGPPGSPGPRGMPGPPGIPGYSGMNGHNGEPGVCNCRKGPKGTTGPVGRQGPMGNEGPRGPQGLPGDEGSPGSTGQKGEPGNCTGAGLKGEAGPPGKRGVTGEKGEIGEPGEDAVCDAQFCRQSVVGSDRSGTEQSTDAERNSDRKFSAFSVSRYGTAEAEDGTTIVTWDHEFSNVGGDFSPDTGIFNCSIPGFYYFTFHIYKSSTGNYPMVRLMLNGEVQVSIIDADYWDSEDSSSNSVILELGLGDAVWLDLYHGRVLHSSYYRYTTFSGTIIHAA